MSHMVFYRASAYSNQTKGTKICEFVINYNFNTYGRGFRKHFIHFNIYLIHIEEEILVINYNFSQK